MTTDQATTTLHPAHLLENGRPSASWLFVDVRTPREFRGVHIEGSLNIPLSDVPAQAERIRNQAAGKQVALVCRTGQRACEAQERLAAASAVTASVLSGGILAWETEGHPVERGQAGMSLERQVRILAGSLVVVGVGLGLFVHAAFLGLAAFIGAGLVFAGLSDTCGMGMMLAKMPWNRG